MKFIKILLLLLACFFIGFMIGSEYAKVNPSPFQCVSVCVEEFEKYGC